MRSSTESFLTHVHLFSTTESHSIHPLELALVWVALLLAILVVVLLGRNLYKHLHTPHLVQRLQAYSQGPDLDVAVTDNGTIIPSVSYYDQEEAANILSRHRRGRGRTRETARREKTRKVSRKINSVNRVNPEDSNVLHLEMQLVLIDEKAEDKIIKDDQSQEEIMIDEILSMSMDALLETPKVPDRLLSPMVRRSRPVMSALPRREEEMSGTGQQSGVSDSLEEISLPRPLLPPYLPTKPVSLVWSRRHNTAQLYRYNHIERLVYPYERVIVPPAYIR